MIHVVFIYRCSFVSSLNIISLPAEIYTVGTIFMLGFFFWPIGIIIASRLFIPVFRDLKVVSLFKVRQLTSWSTMLATVVGGLKLIGHINAQSFLLIIFQFQPISLQYSRLSVEQPIRFRLSVVFASLGISKTIEDNSNVNMPYYHSLFTLDTDSQYFHIGRMNSVQFVWWK